MPTTKLQIWNNALGLLDTQHLPDTALSPDNGECARVLNTHWQETVEHCFEAGFWNFALTRWVLPRLATETPAFGYTYYFGVPNQCLNIHPLFDRGDSRDPLLEGWTIEAGGVASPYRQRIASNFEGLFLRGVDVSYRDTPGRWTQGFADYVAAELALRSTKLNTAGDTLKKIDIIHKRRKTMALSHDSMNQPRPAIGGRMSWSNARFRGSRGLSRELR